MNGLPDQNRRAVFLLDNILPVVYNKHQKVIHNVKGADSRKQTL